MEDDCDCEYDSTWDTESDGDDPAGESQTRRSNQDKNKPSWAIWHHTPRNMRAAKDMQNYRRRYPNLTDDECLEEKMSNLQFYLNKFPSAPDDIYIESFHKDWKNDYKKLERVHSYIQWLFPLREPGVNYMASELTKKEIEAFKGSEDAKRRLVESYELMLGFYGIRLVNKDTGEVKRADNWKERFGNLERNMHNNLRITRILKSLGELGFEHYQAPLVRFFLEETLVKKTLSSVKRSVLDYFLFAVLDKQKRQELIRFAYFHYEPKDKFVWCPRRIQKQFRKSEKKWDSAGSGEGKDEASSRSKSKDGESAAQQKEDEQENVCKAQKGTDKNKEKSKQTDGSCETKVEADALGNLSEAVTCDDEIIRNGKDSLEDHEMDQSPSPDTNTTKTPSDLDSGTKPDSDMKEQDADAMQIDGDTEMEKPQQKKKEEAPSDHRDSTNGQTDGNAAANKTAAQTSPSVHTPPKTAKHSPSRLSEREGKIPRTDFSSTSNKKNEKMFHEANGLEGSAVREEQRNGEHSEEIEMELTSPSSCEKQDSS